MRLLHTPTKWIHPETGALRRPVGAALLTGLCTAGLCLWTIAAQPENPLQNSSNSNLLTLQAMRNAVSEPRPAIRSFRVKGVVCASVPERKMVVLQDDTATILLELPSLGGTTQPGDWLIVEGEQISIGRTRMGLQVGNPLVVDNNGIHSLRMKSGRAFLRKGMQPIHLRWFNGPGDFALSVEYEGPKVQRQPIPNSALWHRSEAPTGGLEFER